MLKKRKSPYKNAAAGAKRAFRVVEETAAQANEAAAGVVGTIVAFVAAYALAFALVPVLGTSKKDASARS